MVDLVKIRKKAKKDREDAAAPAPEPAHVPVSAAATADPRKEPVHEAPPAPPPAAEPAKAAGRGGRSAEPPQPQAAEARRAKAAPAKESAPAPAAEAVPASPSPGSAPGAPTSAKLERFKELAGKRRETEQGEAGEVERQGRLELLTFLIGSEQYAVDIERIVEIVTPRPLTRIPNSDPSVVGIISLRGTIVTLVDVRRKLRHRGEAVEGPETRVVVMDYGIETVGFAVDRVLRVVKVMPEEIEPHPVVHTTELDEAIRGVFRVSGALTILLELDKLLGGSR